MNKPDVIFFDLDETLVENRLPIQDVFARMYFDFQTELGVDQKSAFFDALREQAATLWSGMFYIDTPPEQQFVDCFEHTIATACSINEVRRKTLALEMFQHFLNLSANNVSPSEGALETLKTLSNNGYTTGIITNGMEQVQLGKIHALSLHEKVDHVIVSAQARAHKPHIKVFNLALSRADTTPDKAWQIGDHPVNDVAGAIRAGMQGLFYNPTGLKLSEVFSDIDEQPSHTIQRLSDILTLLNV